jgi:hypothetical protein
MGVPVCYKINNVYVYNNINFLLHTAHMVQDITKIFLPIVCLLLGDSPASDL